MIFKGCDLVVSFWHGGGWLFGDAAAANSGEHSIRTEQR
jgi:hypothetical protein